MFLNTESVVIRDIYGTLTRKQGNLHAISNKGHFTFYLENAVYPKE